MTITLFFKETDYSLRKNSSRGKIKFSEDQNRPQERFCKTLHVVHKPDFQTEIWRVFNCIHLWFNQYCKLIKFRKVYNSRKLCIRQQFSMQKNIFYIFMCMIKNNGDVFPFVQFMCLPVDGGTMSSAVSFFFFFFFFPPSKLFSDICWVPQSESQNRKRRHKQRGFWKGFFVFLFREKAKGKRKKKLQLICKPLWTKI